MNKRVWLSFVLLFALALQTLPGRVAAQNAAAAMTTATAANFDRSRYAIKHQKFVLPNGLTLLVHEDHNVPIVGVNLWYHVGSRNEKRGKTGFAHLFEHFFFNGSENYPHGFREAMDDLGANNRNGTTNTDRTNFFLKTCRPSANRAFSMRANWSACIESTSTSPATSPGGDPSHSGSHGRRWDTRTANARRRTR